MVYYYKENPVGNLKSIQFSLLQVLQNSTIFKTVTIVIQPEFVLPHYPYCGKYV